MFSFLGLFTAFFQKVKLISSSEFCKLRTLEVPDVRGSVYQLIGANYFCKVKSFFTLSQDMLKQAVNVGKGMAPNKTFSKAWTDLYRCQELERKNFSSNFLFVSLFVFYYN